MTTPTESSEPGMLADLGLSEVSDNPNETPDGQYKAVVHEVKLFTHADRKPGENKFLIITYRIVESDPITINVGGQPRQIVLKDNTIDEWKSANPGDNPKQKSFLKQRLLSLGMSEEDVNKGNVQPRALVGTPVIVRVKNKDGYTNINKVTLADDKTWETTTTGAAPTNGATPGPVRELDF